MLYNVAQLLKESIGASRKRAIDGELYDLDENNPGPVPVHGSVTLIRIEKGILAQGRAVARPAAICRRCLEIFEGDVAFEFEEEFIPSIDIETGAALPIVEDDSPELVIDERHILDLREVIRQYIVMEGLTSALCSPECKGLCSQCGHNLNEGTCACNREYIDPRLEFLRQLFDTQDSTA